MNRYPLSQVQDSVKKLHSFTPPLICFSFTSALGVGYMMVCTASYPNVLAFCFLDELQKEFLVTYESKRIGSAVRPYSFIEFGEFCDKLPSRYELLYTRSCQRVGGVSGS